MVEQELIQRIKQLEENQKYIGAIDRKFALLQTEWHEYEKAYKTYIHKRYRIRDWLFKIYYRLRYGKYPDIRKTTAKRMARIFTTRENN